MDQQRHLLIGATSGLGLATAKHLLNLGDEVIVLGNQHDEVAEVAETLGVDARVCDISNGALVEQILKEIFHQYGHIDGIAHCAAMWIQGDFVGHTLDQLRKAAEVNWLGPQYVMHAALQHLLEQGSGNFVWVGAAAVHAPHPGIPVYGAAKAGLEYLVKCLAARYGPRGVKVTYLHPGPMQTKLQERVGLEFLDDVYAEPASIAPILAFLLRRGRDEPYLSVDLAHNQMVPTNRWY